MIWYGRWVSMYKNGDVVQFIPKSDGRIHIGNLKLVGEYCTSEQVKIIDRKGIEYSTKDILIISPFSKWYKDRQDELYDSILEHYYKEDD